MEPVDRLGERLRAAGFNGQAAANLRAGVSFVPPAAALRLIDRPDDACLATLLWLFGDGRTIDHQEAEQALAPISLDELIAGGILEPFGDGVRSCVRLADFEGLIVAGDPDRDGETKSYVSALSLGSKYTARLTLRRKVATALDLGTGSGVQALLAARHADRVVSVDINSHALSLARMSQRLSGEVGAIDWVEGSWLEPVRDQRFDLIVAQPPYVVSPDNDMTYRDTDAEGDELSRELVRACAGALAEGGFATIMCNWIHRPDDWQSPLRTWTDGLGCDALLLHHATQDPLRYAMSWNYSLAPEHPERFRETVTRWLADYVRNQTERIANGCVVLRRRAGGSNWTQAFESIVLPAGPTSEHLVRMFDAGDFLASSAGARQLSQLLSQPWRLLNGHRLDQQATYTDGVYAGEARIGLPDVGIIAKFDPRVLPVLLGCDGTRSLGALIERAAVPDDLQRSAFHSMCLGAVRDLIARGYLQPAS